MMVEYYHNAAAPFTDFKSLHPLSFHLAFQVDDVSRVRARLLQAGATDEGEPSGNDRGDQFAMLRDPWGLPVQLVKRHQPMVQ
jgi:uncharacterized glyoxalase superfamily protein PhnB